MSVSRNWTLLATSWLTDVSSVANIRSAGLAARPRSVCIKAAILDAPSWRSPWLGPSARRPRRSLEAKVGELIAAALAAGDNDKFDEVDDAGATRQVRAEASVRSSRFGTSPPLPPLPLPLPPPPPPGGTASVPRWPLRDGRTRLDDLPAMPAVADPAAPLAARSSAPSRRDELVPPEKDDAKKRLPPLEA